MKHTYWWLLSSYCTEIYFKAVLNFIKKKMCNKPTLAGLLVGLIAQTVKFFFAC